MLCVRSCQLKGVAWINAQKGPASKCCGGCSFLRTACVFDHGHACSDVRQPAVLANQSAAISGFALPCQPLHVTAQSCLMINSNVTNGSVPAGELEKAATPPPPPPPPPTPAAEFSWGGPRHAQSAQSLTSLRDIQSQEAAVTHKPGMYSTSVSAINMSFNNSHCTIKCSETS